MTQFLLTSPVTAVQYTGRNASELKPLVDGNNRRSSHTNMSGPLHFYNDGPDLFVNQGDWVVRIGEITVVLSDESFTTLFASTER